MIREGFTFDDLLLVPRASRVLPVQARLKTRLARKINLNIPLVSAAMDTVTDAKLAIALAQHGGIGIIHKNFSVEEQVREVEIVKRAANGIVHNPIALSPEARINEAMEYMQGHSVSSFV
ncbi:MAG TPA: IMP dehydrogenase, partial [Spirochaetota bacterium]|nr:IMP dehydrogenase [Spirochaetota bacterium]